MALTSALERSVHRKGTERFIASDPTTIVLNTQGGEIVDGTFKSNNGTQRSAQQFKLIWSEQSGIFREDGETVRRFDVVIVALHDAIIEIGDTFETGDNKYIVTYIYPYNDYEVRAGCVSHGANPGNT